VDGLGDWQRLEVFLFSTASRPKSLDGTVGTATGYELDDQEVGVPSPGGGKNFNFSMSSRPALGYTQPTIQFVPGVKRQWDDFDHSLPPSAEVKKTWVYTSTPPYVFMA
jgi:hypothetical protein